MLSESRLLSRDKGQEHQNSRCEQLLSSKAVVQTAAGTDGFQSEVDGRLAGVRRQELAGASPM